MKPTTFAKFLGPPVECWWTETRNAKCRHRDQCPHPFRVKLDGAEPWRQQLILAAAKMLLQPSQRWWLHLQPGTVGCIALGKKNQLPWHIFSNKMFYQSFHRFEVRRAVLGCHRARNINSLLLPIKIYWLGRETRNACFPRTVVCLAMFGIFFVWFWMKSCTLY